MCPPSPANPAPLPPSLCSSAVSLTSSARPGAAQPCLWESKNPRQNRKRGTPKPQLLNTESNRAASSPFFCSRTACEACSRTRTRGPQLLFPQSYVFPHPHVSVLPVLSGTLSLLVYTPNTCSFCQVWLAQPCLLLLTTVPTRSRCSISSS